MRAFFPLSLCLAAIALTPAAAFADDDGSGSAYTRAGGITDNSPKIRPQMISLFAFPTWANGFGGGLGVRYTLPIVHNGFIPQLNDSFELEFGADAWYGGTGYFYQNGFYANYGGFYGYVGLMIPVEARWTFHLTDRFEAYAKVGIALGMTFPTNSAFSTYLYPYGIGATGVLFRVSDSVYLRGEIGNFGLRGGVGFAF